MAAQQDGKGLTKICIEGVDDGVEGWISPTEPNKHVKRGGADAGERFPSPRVLAEGYHAVKDEEREPAAHKHPHDHRQRLQYFGLPFECHFERALWLCDAGASAHAVMSVLGTFRRPFQCGDPPDLSVGDAIDLCVCGHHDDHGDIEAYEGGGDGICPVQTRVTVFWAMERCSVERWRHWGAGERDVGFSLGFVPIELHWNEGNKYRKRPRHTDHHVSHSGCHFPLITEGTGDGPVAIHTYNTQV